MLLESAETVYNRHFGTTKTWSLYRNTVSNEPLIKWSLCTGFLKKSACQI